MASLYEEGWRQGTIFETALPMDAVVLGESSGRPERRLGDHSRWVIATQDCDLDQTESTNAEPTIELRPVFTQAPPPDWGIRSAKLRLTDEDSVESASSRTITSAAVLTALKAGGVPTYEPPSSRRRAFTIWLGKRYDRPAVPPQLMPLARKIAEVVSDRRNRPTGAQVRDVLMQFDETTSPMRFSLFAVLDNEADEHEVRNWLSSIALHIPSELGVADQIEAASASGISLQLIEDSYSADVSVLTWRRNNPDPDGAT
jgi:hypothetical protein